MRTSIDELCKALLIILCLNMLGGCDRDNPSIWKYTVEGDFHIVLDNLKAGLQAEQFQITGQENLSRGLENNKTVFGEKEWNTIGFKHITAVHFCSIAVNHELINLNMNWSLFCPFKAVLYAMKDDPEKITVITTRPSYLLAEDPHRDAKEIGEKIEKRLLNAIKNSIDVDSGFQ